MSCMKEETKSSSTYQDWTWHTTVSDILQIFVVVEKTGIMPRSYFIFISNMMKFIQATSEIELQMCVQIIYDPKSPHIQSMGGS